MSHSASMLTLLQIRDTKSGRALAGKLQISSGEKAPRSQAMVVVSVEATAVGVAATGVATVLVAVSTT